MLYRIIVRACALAAITLLIPTLSPRCLAGSHVPDVNRVVLVTGQNVDSITGYVAAMGERPGGIMSYTSTASVEGLTSIANYGSGNVHAQYFVNDPGYDNTVMQMGLYLNGDLLQIISGLRDINIAIIGNWIKNAGRPVYLRIGYEFDGPWNALPPDQFVPAYRHIVDRLRALGVTNASYVWHSACVPPYGGHSISAWYPGDDYVDWAGISIFSQFNGSLGTVSDIDNFCAFAKSKNKPIMIAESAPYGGMSDARWANWFLPCIELIRRHHIQMWSYINTDWESQPLFAGQGWGDTRIQQNALVQSNWTEMLNDPLFLQQTPELFSRLHENTTDCRREAESASLNGTVGYGDASASGGTAVGGLNAPGRAITFTNGGPAVQFVLRYNAANPGTIGLYVNSQPRRTLPIPAANVSAYRDLLVHAAIPAGAAVKFQFDAGDTGVNMDSILFRGYADSDSDGLPDDWERWRLGSLNNGSNNDPDDDGSSNYSEFVADTNPLDGNSCLRINSLSMSGGTGTATFTPPASRDYFIQQSSDMKNWTFLLATAGSNATSVVLPNLPATKGFLRVCVP